MQGIASVKLVLSADTVILRGKPVSGPPPERLLSFSNISSPRIGSLKEEEEPFAFKAREFLRNLIIANQVMFKLEYKSISNRDYGFLLLNPANAIDGETNVTRILVKYGWAKVKIDGSRELSEEQNILTMLELEAQAAGRGIWSIIPDIPRTVLYTLDGNPRDFLDKYKGGIPMNAIVDQIRDGSTYRISLQIDPNTWQIITFSLSGIKSPACRRDVPNMEDLVEPFGEEAKYFAETRILHREVKIILESNNNNTFIGTLLHPSGNIAEALLSEGFARVVDWSVTVVTGGPEKLRAAEQKAKISKIRIWREFVAKKAISNGKVSEFDGKVVKIINSDLIAVLCNGIERKISFSSLKAPKLNPKDTTLNRDSHFNAEAREFLRSRLIGKIVHVKVFYINTKIDFVKLPTEGFTDERECATVTFNDTNIAESMISKGLATVIRHKKDDDDRSSQYDLLLVAEVNAIAQLKGLHNPVDPVMVRVNDASESLMKAKQFLPWLQKSKKIGCIVDFCASGGRFKILIPSQNCKFTFILSGVKVARVARTPAEKSEPMGKESLDFVNSLCLQREVEISVENLDKVGGFIGSMYVDKNNLAIELLTRGLAQIHEYSASQCFNEKALYAAEQVAKDGRVGIWSIIDPQSEEFAPSKASGLLSDEKMSSDYKDCILSDVLSSTLSVQLFTSGILE